MQYYNIIIFCNGGTILGEFNLYDTDEVAAIQAGMDIVIENGLAKNKAELIGRAY